MRRYETTFVVNPQADDAAIDRQVAAVADLIKTDGGKILDERRMGTRRLAYPIEGLVQGFYSSFVYDAEITVLPKLERLFKLEEPYVRYLTIRYEGPLPSDEVETTPVATGAKAASKPPEKAEKADTADKADSADKVGEAGKADKAEKAVTAEKTETAAADAPAKQVETEAKSDPEPAAEAKAVEEPTPAAPKPADPADEEL